MNYGYPYAVIIKSAQYCSDDVTTGHSPQRLNEAIYLQGGSRGKGRMDKHYAKLLFSSASSLGHYKKQKFLGPL